MRKIAIYGAGAVGGLIGARLAGTNCQLSAVARGTTLEALRLHGLRIQVDDQIRSMSIHVEQHPEILGPQDAVILAVKSPSLPEVATNIAPLLGPDTIVITAMNGIPWWFFQSAKAPYRGTQLRSLDPAGTLSASIPVHRIIGCVVHLACSCPEPGLIKPGAGNRLIVGEPAGGATDRLLAIADLLRQSGFEVEASADIRSDIWYKLWGNMTMNPISAITGATCDAALDDPQVLHMCLTAMQEAATIGAAIGCPITQSGTNRIAVARKLGAFKTSMLQDAEAGKMLEIDSLITVVHEIGKLVQVPTPTIDSLLGLVRLFGRTHGLYPACASPVEGPDCGLLA